MKKTRSLTLVVSLVLCLTLLMGIGVSATNSLTVDGSPYVTAKMPQSPMKVDKDVLTFMSAGMPFTGCTPTLLGANFLWGGLYTKEGTPVNNQSVLFGTDVNESPDPYVYNYNYNRFYAIPNGLKTTEDAMGEGTQRPSAAQIAAVLPSLKPDILIYSGIGATASTDSAVAAYQSVVDQYNSQLASGEKPYKLYYYGGNACGGQLYEAADDLIAAGKFFDHVCKEKGKKLRYGSGYTTATDIDKFCFGYYAYTLSALEKYNIPKKTVCVLNSTTDEGANWTLNKPTTTGGNRYSGAVAGTTTNIYDTIGSQVSLEQVLSCDVICTTGKAKTRQLKAAITSAGMDPDTALKGKVILEEFPQSIWVMEAQLSENVFAAAYANAMMYGKEIAAAGGYNMNPVYATAYWYQNFLHVTNNATLIDMVDQAFNKVDLPDGMTTDISRYDAAYVERIVTAGLEYAYSTDVTKPFTTTSWKPDLSVGIGSISSCNVKVGSGSVTVTTPTGKKLTKDKDYTLSYSSNAVTVKGKGIYAASDAMDSAADFKKSIKTVSFGNLKYTISSKSTVKVSGLTSAGKKATSLSIPATVKINGKTYKVTAISGSAFKNDTKVTKVTVGNNVKSIGEKAFANCSKLKTVTIGKAVTSIGSKAFYGDKKLTTLKINGTALKSVGSKAFTSTPKSMKVSANKKKLTSYKKLLTKAGASSKITTKAL